MHHHRAAGESSRCGFTLVELLVVVTIIALLLALVTPTVMKSLGSARAAAIKTEIDLLHVALMNYKNEYGSFPPSFSSTNNINDRAARHVQRLFPRCANVPAQLGTITVSPSNAIVSWLLGYTGDPMSPLQPQSARKKLFDFDVSRTTTGAYAPAKLPNSTYVYIDSGAYGTVSTPATFAIGSQTYSAQIQELSTGTTFFNADSFQILCAGADQMFGNEDDLSNFWPGTRKQYLDSLKGQ